MTVRYDPAEAMRLADPYPYYAALRSAGRVVRGEVGSWAVTHHADVTALFVDPRLSHEFPSSVYRLAGEPDAVGDFFKATVLNRDGPVHAVLRRAMGRMVSHRISTALAPRIGRLVTDLFAEIRQARTVDLVTSLAYPLPAIVAAELLGIPSADREEVRPRAMSLGRAFGSDEHDKDPTAAVKALAWLRDYMNELVRDRESARDQGDLVSGLLAQAGPQLSRSELIDNIIFLFFAGSDPTTNMLATGCVELLFKPHLLRELQENPSLAVPAVDEFMRYDCPIQTTARIAREPVEIGSQVIRKDRIIVLLLGAANRDESQFPSPDEIILDRSPNPHFGFSGGAHHCLGATLARAQGAAVFGYVARELDVFEPAGPPVRRPHLNFRGYERVPAQVG
jgi:cytochrome P450